jgi:hypothetical protein
MQRAARPFSTVDHFIAFALAFAWMAGGIFGVALGVYRRQWTTLVISLLALAYGMVWLRAARTGRKISLQEALWPWKR